MNSAAELNGIFIVLGATTLVFAHIVNMGEIGSWETD